MTIQERADAIIHAAVRTRREPYAVFAFDQPDFDGGTFPMYTIYGGPSDRSTVTAETLRVLGIAIPERG